LRSSTPTGKLTESSNVIIENGALLIYSEDDFRTAYLAYKQELKDLFSERAECPAIEEFRLTFEDELVDMYYNNTANDDDDND
jgi:hypothetical protein